QVAYFPTQKPGTAAELAIPPPADAQSLAAATPQSLVTPAQSAEQTTATADKAAGVAAASAPKKPEQVASTEAATGGAEADDTVYVTAGEMPAPAPEKPRKTFLAA